MVMSPTGLRLEKDSAGDAQQQQNQPLVREGTPHEQTHNCLKNN
jgi:hypothetical protein